jgi:hypothetical protein
MMLESFAMNRPINNDEIEMFLRSLSCAEICQQLSTTTASTGEIRGEHHDSRTNEYHPAFCHTETPSEPFNPRQHQSNIAEVNKGGFLEICINLKVY